MHGNEHTTDVAVLDFEDELRALAGVKAEEFAFLGYEKISADDILACVFSRFKKEPRLHEFTAEILSLKITQFMQYETMRAYKGQLGE